MVGTVSAEDRRVRRRDSGGVPESGNLTGGKPLRIGIDARPLRWPGIGRYVRELIVALAEVDALDEFFVYCSGDHVGQFEGRWPNVRVRAVGSRLYSVREQVSLPVRILLDRLHLFHSPASLTVPLLCPSRLVVTVHDLLLKNHPEQLASRLGRLYFRVMNARALRSSSQLLTVSDFTRNVLVAAYPSYAGKVRTVHNGVSAAFKPAGDEGRLRRLKQVLGLRKRYVLYVGTYKKHKNVPFLIEAYSQLGHKLRADVQLVLLGRRDPRFPEADALIARLGLQPNVVQVADLDEEDLIALYSGAAAVAVPSVYEGFGFPLLEAMSCGTAAVATRIPAFMEVAGECAVLVEPDDAAAFSAALARVLTDRDLCARLRAAGLERSARFGWGKTALATLDAYRVATSPKSRA